MTAWLFLHVPSEGFPNDAEHLALLKRHVVDINSAIIRDGAYIQNTVHMRDAGLSVCDFIGAPDANISESICKMLAAEGVLVQHLVLDTAGKQLKIKPEEGNTDLLLWTYTWASDASQKLKTLTEYTLSALAWDLRRHSNFANITVVHVDENSQSALDTAEELPQDDTSVTD